MSRNEDYLDNLLTSVTDKLNEFDEDFEQNRESLRESYQTQSDLPQKTQSALDEVREDNFLREFENELQSDDDDFIREFEQELNAGTDQPYDSPQVDAYVNQMGQIMDSSEKADNDEMPLEVDTMSQSDDSLEDLFRDAGDDFGMSQTNAAGQDVGEDVFSQVGNGQEGSIEAPEGMEGLEDIFGDLDGAAQNGTADAAQSSSFQEPLDEPLFDGPPKEQTAQQPDDELEQLLGESDDEALSEIGRMLDADESGTIVEVPLDQGDPFTNAADFAFEESSKNHKKQRAEKKKKEKNPNSLFGKLSKLLFGTPEELDPEMAAKIAEAAAASGENQQLDPKALKEKKKQEKELKKQQKKEAAEEKKKEKEAAKAEKAAKQAAKPKKEKKPKQKKKLPKEPPLPKVPVTMMWVIALSIMVLVFLGASLIGYSSPVSQSREAFNQGDYVTAYTKLQGVKVKASETKLYNAASALAGIQTELDAYTALMEQKQYEMALDALVRGFGRCELHAAEAEEWGVSEQLTEMDKQLVKLLKEQFDVSKRKARKLYKIKKRSEYTLELHEILEGLGLA